MAFNDWSEQYKKYQYAKEDAKLAMCQNIAEYLSKLNTQRYTIAIVSCNEYTKNWGEIQFFAGNSIA